MNNISRIKKLIMFSISSFLIIQSLTFNAYLGNAITISKESVVIDTNLCSSPSFSYYLKLPGNLKGYFDYDEGLKCAKKKNRPYLVCFSTQANVNAMEMFATVLLEPDITRTINDNYVFALLQKNCKIYLPLHQQVISTINGDTIRSLGNKNTYYQSLYFKEDIQPSFYIINFEEELLVEPYYFDTSISSFKEFLKNGIDKYHQNIKK